MQRLSIQMTAALCVAAVGMSGCVGAHYDPATGLYARTLGGAPATPNPTPYTQSLECLARAARAQSLRGPTLAVGAISDLTGKNDWDTGRKVSQGAALFAITALGRAGLPVIAPRTPSEPDPEVVSTVVPADATALTPRPVLTGQIAGSRYYIVGGVTELNYNIRSSGVDAAGGEVDSQGAKGSFRNSAYVMNIAIDLRLVDSVSQQVAAVASYQKQLIGREIKAGVFDFLDGNVFDISGGASQLEPMQLGVRTLVERGVFDLASHLYGFDRSACLPDGLESEDGVTPLLPLGPHHILMAEDAAPRIARAVEPEIERRLEAATPIPLPVQTLSNRSVQAHPGPVIEPGTWRVRR
jgi:curli production assembly/transport component CsgG/holdfast attachment protein HfaB